MKLTLYSVAGLIGLVSANVHLNLHLQHKQNPHDWVPAGPDDVRSPCPMLNTLANHNYLSHDGRNISRDGLADALMKALNFDPALAHSMFDNAQPVLEAEGTSEFDLDQLSTHNILEHDASLSRQDAHFGDNARFNPNVFAQTTSFWTAATVTAKMLANSKVARQVHSKAFNPNYAYPAKVETAGCNEAAFPIVAFGDLHEGTVEREFVTYFFENERLPTEVGWTARDEQVNQAHMDNLIKMIGDAASLVTGEEAGTGKQRRGPHGY
ncbi:Chloroperoxidase [Aspergillus aurantiobrunneus]